MRLLELCGFAASLGFVGLLARAQQVLDRCGGFDSLALFEFTYPGRDRGHHIAGGLTCGIGGGLFDHLPVPSLRTLDDFYFFLGHICGLGSLKLSPLKVGLLTCFYDVN
jgi:hypothetical protein